MANKLVSNLLSSSNFTTYLVVGVSLVIILLLVFLKNKNFELFSASTTLPLTLTMPTTTKPKNTITTKAETTKASTTKPNAVSTNPVGTIPLLKNDIIQNSALVNFINRFIVNKNQQNVYSSTLTDRQGQINNLSEQVLNLVNPSS